MEKLQYVCHRAALFLCRFLVAHQEVQNVPAVGALGLIQLGIAAVDTADGDELLVLHVKELGEVAAGGLELVALILGSAALVADVL